ncbi:Bacterial regulatory protein, tetR family [compost metagenome]
MLELFARKDFDQVGMRELATYLGLSPGSLYHYYPRKQDLLFDLIEEFYDELISNVQSVERKGQKNRNGYRR